MSVMEEFGVFMEQMNKIGSGYWGKTTTKQRMMMCFTEGRKSGLEEAASVVDAECARVLALQIGKNTNMEQSIDINIRMTAVLLPGLSDAIRQRSQEATE